MSNGMTLGLEKFQALVTLGDRYGCPWVEYQESVTGSQLLLWKLDMVQLRMDGWFPRIVTDSRAATATGRQCKSSTHRHAAGGKPPAKARQGGTQQLASNHQS